MTIDPARPGTRPDTDDPADHLMRTTRTVFTMASPERSAAQVVVALSGHSKEDADAVFGVLHACYPPARPPTPRRRGRRPRGTPRCGARPSRCPVRGRSPPPPPWGRPSPPIYRAAPARWNSCATSWPPPSPYRTRAGRPVTRSANCTCGWRAARALYFLAPARRNAHSMRRLHHTAEHPPHRARCTAR